MMTEARSTYHILKLLKNNCDQTQIVLIMNINCFVFKKELGPPMKGIEVENYCDVMTKYYMPNTISILSRAKKV